MRRGNLLERKYGDRSDWKRIIKREYTQTYLDSTEFKGYVTLLKIHHVSNPLVVQYDQNRICIVNNGYSWLQHFPIEKRHSVTTMFNSNGEIVQWYIDICHSIGISNDVPWLDDLFLDIVVLPSGEIIRLDDEELENALATGIIDHTLYKSACDEADQITRLIKSNEFKLMNLASGHRNILLNQSSINVVKILNKQLQLEDVDEL